ncbi:MAG: hypothetical protein FJ271_23055, partial [Planctomycetes bacterium]|nr:hypothetical protein [Planctomycetota bacterium]
DGLLRKWLARLPHPFPAPDRAAGYLYDVSILQAEFALTQVLEQRRSPTAQNVSSFTAPMTISFRSATRWNSVKTAQVSW